MAMTVGTNAGAQRALREVASFRQHLAVSLHGRKIALLKQPVPKGCVEDLEKELHVIDAAIAALKGGEQPQPLALEEELGWNK